MTGGRDIHPRRWDRSEALDPTADPDEERDELELQAVGKAWELGLPILGICRGEQFLNVARGGSLIQDIPGALGVEPGLHDRGTSQKPELAHAVTVAPGSRVAALVGALEVDVNSRHHQAVKGVAPDLKAVAWYRGPSQGGEPLVEAVEARDPGRWAVGVQWHPENLVALEGPAGQAALGIFRGFVQALQGR
jgi:putative glutamine amidotransferase